MKFRHSNIGIALLAMLFGSSMHLQSQNFRVQAPPGYNYIYPENNYLKGTEGSPYLEDWQQADILFTNGGEIKDLLVRYNVFSNQMLYKDKNVTYMMSSPDSILELNFPDKSFIFKRYTLKQKEMNSFFEVVVKGKITLLNKYEIEVTPANYNEALFSGNKNDVLNLKQKLYVMKDSTILPLDSKDRLSELLSDRKVQIEALMKKERLSIRKKEDMGRLIAFYNNII